MSKLTLKGKITEYVRCRLEKYGLKISYQFYLSSSFDSVVFMFYTSIGQTRYAIPINYDVAFLDMVDPDTLFSIIAIPIVSYAAFKYLFPNFSFRSVLLHKFPRGKFMFLYIVGYCISFMHGNLFSKKSQRSGYFMLTKILIWDFPKIEISSCMISELLSNLCLSRTI